MLEFAESLFYAYRTTGNVTYQERAWDIFQHITAATATTFGYSAIKNVMETSGGGLLNDQETFWLAETLKYLFLIFDDPRRVSLDEWVFNTECHPMRRKS
jgi:mannosyl-oligosaccharide alpha-1,2-mannosidase